MVEVQVVKLVEHTTPRTAEPAPLALLIRLWEEAEQKARQLRELRESQLQPAPRTVHVRYSYD